MGARCNKRVCHLERYSKGKAPASQSLSDPMHWKSSVPAEETRLVADARFAYVKGVKRGLGQFSVWASTFGLCLSAAAATDPFLQLSSPSFTNGLVQFTLTGERGVNYVIESSPDLMNWSRMLTNSSDEITRLISFEASNGPTFFRTWRKGPLYWAGLAAKLNITLK